MPPEASAGSIVGGGWLLATINYHAFVSGGAAIVQPPRKECVARRRPRGPSPKFDREVARLLLLLAAQHRAPEFPR
jgi:hypothetical protein